MYKNPTSPTFRWELEARVMADEPPAQITKKTGLNGEIVKIYEDLIAKKGENEVLYDELGPKASRPETWTANTMAFVLRPTADGGTRLILRMRADGTETGFARWMWNGPLNFGGALFSHKTLVGIKRTAEQIAKE